MAAVEKRTFDAQYVADNFSIHPHAHSMPVVVVLGLPPKWSSHYIVDMMHVQSMVAKQNAYHVLCMWIK